MVVAELLYNILTDTLASNLSKQDQNGSNNGSMNEIGVRLAAKDDTHLLSFSGSVAS